MNLSAIIIFFFSININAILIIIAFFFVKHLKFFIKEFFFIFSDLFSLTLIHISIVKEMIHFFLLILLQVKFIKFVLFFKSKFHKLHIFSYFTINIAVLFCLFNAWLIFNFFFVLVIMLVHFISYFLNEIIFIISKVFHIFIA